MCKRNSVPGGTGQCTTRQGVNFLLKRNNENKLNEHVNILNYT